MMHRVKGHGADLTLLGRTRWPSPEKRRAHSSSEGFDLSQPSLKDHLCAALNVEKDATIERNPGINGAMNDGTWIVRNRHGREDLVVKMVPGSRRKVGELTEAESFIKLDREHPTLASDATLAFPIKILHVDGRAHGQAKDLIVMRKAPGEALALLMARKKRAGQETSVMRIFEKIGECVAVFHKRYGGKQHGDLHGSNIFVDETSNRVTLIDLRDMGDKNRITDMEYFAYSLRLVAKTYPCVEEYIHHFQIGYASGRSKQIKALDRHLEPLQRLCIAMGCMGLQSDSEITDDEEDVVTMWEEDMSEVEKESPDERLNLLPVLPPLFRWAQMDFFGACACSDTRADTPIWEELEDPYDEIFG